MTQAQLLLQLLPVYACGCLLAWLLMWGQPRRQRLLPLLYGMLATFVSWRFNGSAPHFHFWWYLWMAVVDSVLVAVAFGSRCRVGKVVGIVGVIAIAFDLVFFIMASPVIGHRLPGYYYYVGSNALESLQVGAMIAGSGPVLPAAARMWQVVTNPRGWWWIHHRRLQRV